MKVIANEQVIVAKDFNSRVGLEGLVGKYSDPRMNDNGK